MTDPTLLRVFMSYRRDDAAGHAGRLYDSLISRHDVADVFMDVGNIEPGLDFTVAIEKAIETTDVMLVLIGPRWATAVGPDGRLRLEDPDDHVAAEIAAALARDVRVIPVLLENASMPSAEALPERIRGLANRNAIDLSTVSWPRDVESLVAVLHRITPRSVASKPETTGDRPGPTGTESKSTIQRRIALVSIGTLILGGAVVALIYDGNDADSDVPTTAVTTMTPTGGSSVPVTTEAVGGPEEIVLEAEIGTIESPMSSESDESASGGRFVQANERGGAVDFTFEVNGGDYVVWARAAAGADDPLRHDSFIVAVDGGDSDIWDLFETTEIPPTDWSWDQVSLRCGGVNNNIHNCDPLTLTLDPGEHTLSILGREVGSKLDVVVITNEVDGRPQIAD